MDWLYVSPHLDDAVLSCGGLIHRQVRLGEVVSIWTICAGDPPPGPLSAFAQGQHDKWQLGSDAMAVRRREDRQACEILGASWQHLPYPDCVYRRSPEDGRPLYATEEAIFGPLDPAESSLVDTLAQELTRAVPPGAGVVFPLGVGGHVDHRLARQVAARLSRRLWYYAEMPYVERVASWAGGRSPLLENPAWEVHFFPLAPADMAAWQAAAAAYISQLPVLWGSAAAGRSALAAYQDQVGGARLWRWISGHNT